MRRFCPIPVLIVAFSMLATHGRPCQAQPPNPFANKPSSGNKAKFWIVTRTKDADSVLLGTKQYKAVLIRVTTIKDSAGNDTDDLRARVFAYGDIQLKPDPASPDPDDPEFHWYYTDMTELTGDARLYGQPKKENGRLTATLKNDELDFRVQLTAVPKRKGNGFRQGILCRLIYNANAAQLKSAEYGAPCDEAVDEDIVEEEELNADTMDEEAPAEDPLYEEDDEIPA